MVQKWLGYAEVVEVCGSIYGIWWAPKQNLMEIGRKTGRWLEMLLPGAGCPGGRPDVRGPDVRALDPGTKQDEHRVERLNPGEIRKNLWMELGGKGMGS